MTARRTLSVTDDKRRSVLIPLPAQESAARAAERHRKRLRRARERCVADIKREMVARISGYLPLFDSEERIELLAGLWPVLGELKHSNTAFAMSWHNYQAALLAIEEVQTEKFLSTLENYDPELDPGWL